MFTHTSPSTPQLRRHFPPPGGLAASQVDTPYLVQTVGLLRDYPPPDPIFSPLSIRGLDFFSRLPPFPFPRGITKIIRILFPLLPSKNSHGTVPNRRCFFL